MESSVDPNPQPGDVLSGRWRLRARIGEGGMGVVFAATHLESGRAAAIKLLRPEMAANASVRGRFEAEAPACMRLSHPNILRVFELSGAGEPAPYFVMELLEGVPLSEYTGAYERLPEALAISILRGTLRGLAHAHAAGIVHRDLKPENVFLARDPSGQFAVKLLDFGIAKVMDAAGGMGTRTRTGALLGTPAYMSPEQARNAKDTDARSDLWSAGVLLFQMLTGEQPFVAPSEFARLALVLSAVPKPLAAFDVALAKWQPVIERALCKDRALRFQSAAEMEAALDVPLASASPPPARTPAGKLIDASRPRNFTPEAFGDTDMSLPAFPPASPQPQQAVQPPRAAASSTLSSPYSAGPEGQPRSFVPVVNIVPSARGDLDSNTFRGRPEGVRGSLVALLVMLALAAGLVTGFALGRL